MLITAHKSAQAKFQNISPLRRPAADSPTVPSESYIPGELPRAEAASSPSKQGALSKALLSGCLAVTAFTGLAPTAHAAMALVQTQPYNQTNGMDVVVLPNGSPRLDLFRLGDTHRFESYSPFEARTNDDRRVDPRDYSPVGVSLGNGLFQDMEGNVSVVPFLAYNWNLEARDFTRVDVGTKGQSVQRFGDTVQFVESSTKRDIYTESEHGVQLKGPQGETSFDRQADGSLVVKTKGDQYTVRTEGMFTRVQREGQPEITIMRIGDEIRVMEGQRTFAGASVKDGVLTTKSAAGETTVTRSQNGVITEIKGRHGLRDARIIRDGDTFLGLKDTDRMSVDDRAMLEQAKARYNEVLDQLEAVEPNFEQNHPLVAEVLKYASANPRLLTGKEEGGFLQAGTLLASAGGAAETVSALGNQAAALSLANSARALGGAALAAKAAAQAQAAAGNMAQAAALAKDAQNFATKAHEAKDAAIRTGGKAMREANFARVMAGVGGALEIVDGVLDYKGGKSDRALVDGARAVTQASMNRLASAMQGDDRLAVQDDYDKVMRVMDELSRQADKKVTVGKLKIGLGGLMVVSALLGPAAPPVLGIIGVAGTAGTAVYEHWGPIKSFLTGESNHVPTFLDILPKSDEVIIHLDGKPIKR